MKLLQAILHTRKHRIIAATGCTLLLMASFCLYRMFYTALDTGTVVGGVDLSGLSPVKARQSLEAVLEESLYSQTLEVHLPKAVLNVSAADCDLQIKTGKVLFDILHTAPDAPGEISLRPYLFFDETALRGVLEDYAARYDTGLTQPSWCLEGNAPDLSTEHFTEDTSGQTLVLTMGIPSVHLDIDAVLEECLQAFSRSVQLCREENYRIHPEVLPEVLPDEPDTAEIFRQITAEPVNDAVDRETWEFVHGAYGTTIDEALLSAKISRAAPGEVIRIPVQYLPPEILGDAACFLDVLGSFETRYTASINRIHNLQLQCDTLDGFVLQPGETFSMNGVLGERTLERGYLPAPAYSGNRMIQSPGGGVCQGSTTLYNCVLLADLEVVFRVGHGVKVGYVPLGLDAAINWLTTDFQFRNNFRFPIQIRAWLEDGYMKMQILGTDEKDYYIKMETTSGEGDTVIYARSYKCKYDKETDELISREVEAYSTYYTNIG